MRRTGVYVVVYVILVALIIWLIYENTRITNELEEANNKLEHYEIVDGSSDISLINAKMRIAKLEDEVSSINEDLDYAASVIVMYEEFIESIINYVEFLQEVMDNNGVAYPEFSYEEVIEK